jgi:hypothetical protein
MVPRNTGKTPTLEAGCIQQDITVLSLDVEKVRFVENLTAQLNFCTAISNYPKEGE